MSVHVPAQEHASTKSKMTKATMQQKSSLDCLGGGDVKLPGILYN